MIKLIRSKNIYKCVNNALRSKRTVELTDAAASINTIKYIENKVRGLRVYEDIELLPAALDWHYLLNKDNATKIDANNKNRKGLGDIQLVVIIFKYLSLSLSLFLSLSMRLVY